MYLHLEKLEHNSIGTMGYCQYGNLGCISGQVNVDF